MDAYVDIIGVVIAFAALVFGIWKVQHENAKTFQKMQDRSDIHDADIQVLKENIDHKEAREKRVEMIQEQINNLRSLHNNDVDKLTKAMEKSNDKNIIIEERHHAEVLSKIEILTEKVTHVCATFEEYRRIKL